MAAKLRKEFRIPSLSTRRTGKVKTCEICGVQFYIKPHVDLNGKNGRFCSHKCQGVWWGRNAREKPCEWCGQSIGKLSPFWYPRRKYCSWKCQVEGRSTSAIDRIHNGRRARRDPYGYIRIYEPDHPEADYGFVYEHRFVAEKNIGRRLRSNEQVHHINGVRDDNDPSNLMVVTPGEHQAFTSAQIVARRRAAAAELAEYRRLYGPLSGGSSPPDTTS